MAYRVLIAQFMHETNTFSKLPTTLDDYRKRWLIEGEAMVPRFTGTRNEIGGYIDSAKKYGWQPVWAGGGQRHAVGQAHPGMLGDDPRHDRRRGEEGRQARRHLPVAARRHGDGDRGRCRGRAARAAARRRRAGRADRRDARPARQCHATHGEQRQCAGELPHLSAYRRLRARGPGGGAGAGGDGGQEEAALPAGASPRCWKAPSTAAPPSPA